MEAKNTLKHLIRDALIICASIFIAIFIAKHDGIGEIVKSDELSPVFAIFTSIISGALFTSVFTIAPASVILIELNDHLSILTISILGGLGAMTIDLLLASFVRKNIASNMQGLSRFSFKWHLVSLFHFGFLKWISFLLGLFIIASPLPDELGLFFIGISKVKKDYLPIVFFIANTTGIYPLLYTANSVI